MHVSKTELEDLLRTYMADLGIDSSSEDSRAEIESIKVISKALVHWSREFFPATSPEKIRIAFLHGVVTITQQIQETVSEMQAKLAAADREIVAMTDELSKLRAVLALSEDKCRNLEITHGLLKKVEAE